MNEVEKVLKSILAVGLAIAICGMGLGNHDLVFTGCTIALVTCICGLIA